MIATREIIVLLILLCQWSYAKAQTPVTNEERQAANQYFMAGDWSSAVRAYQSIADREPQNAMARIRLGVSCSGAGTNKDAFRALEESEKLATTPAVMYSLGSAYARLRNPDKGFGWLEKALTAGYSQRAVFQNDSFLAAYKTDPRYQKASDRFDRAVAPCRYSAESRQFDFWLGEWEVKNAAGQPAGKSSIQILLGDCVIYENWTSAPPNEYEGKSLNFYNATSHQWQQTWVDDKGGLLEFIEGVYRDNTMVFVTRPDSLNQVTRLSFHNLGPKQVRQHFELTTDGGKTWTTTTDLFYYRLK